MGSSSGANTVNMNGNFPSRNYSITPSSSPSSSTWIRVTKRHPCPICTKETWCLLSGDQKCVICMRVESQHPKLFKGGETGWIHRLDQPLERFSPPPPKPAPPTINCSKLIEQWAAETRRDWLEAFSLTLGVRPDALRYLGACYAKEHGAWAFPMKDGYENTVGIRLRDVKGNKWAVTGSHQGCFVPFKLSTRMALVAEGPTDTAAGLDLGFYTVGRPSCSGGMNDLRTLFKRKGVTRAAIVADNDKPGVMGADALTRHLGVPSCIVTLPSKDLRQFAQLGGTKTVLDCLIQSSIWSK